MIRSKIAPLFVETLVTSMAILGGVSDSAGFEVIENEIRDPNLGRDIFNKPAGVLVRNSHYLNGSNDNAQVDFRSNEFVRLENVTITGTSDGASDSDARVFKFGIRNGTAGLPSAGNGRVELFDVDILGIGVPSANYPPSGDPNPPPDTRNRDGVSHEADGDGGNEELFVKNSTIMHASDGIIDAKEPLAARGSHFENSYRILRLWKGVNYIEQCDLVGPTNPALVPEWTYVWFADASVKLYVLDSTFGGASTIPVDRIQVGNGPRGVFDESQIRYLDEPEGLLLDPFIRDPNADFDNGQDVDGTDFLTWQRNFGVMGGPEFPAGDANADHVTDELDLAVWRTQLGSGTQLAFAAPEPATLEFLGGLLACRLTMRAKRRSGPPRD